MSRLEARAVAGFWKTPVTQLPRIAGLLRFPKGPHDPHVIDLLDPCAGEGEAIVTIAQLLQPAWEPPEPEAEPTDDYARKPAWELVRLLKAQPAACDAQDHGSYYGCPRQGCTKYVAPEARSAKRTQVAKDKYDRAVKDLDWVRFFTCEAEATRHQALRERFQHRDAQNALRGDAFRVSFECADRDGVGLLFLNPPYDQDSVHRRFEEKFLARFAPMMTPGGVLVFVVPYYALAASADTLGRLFERVSCYRFAGADYDNFKQVVLFAKRREVDLAIPDPAVAFLVRDWSELPPLDDLPAPGEAPAADVYEIPVRDPNGCAAVSEWKMRVVDVGALLSKFRPWHEGIPKRAPVPITRVLPDVPIVALMHRTFNVAVAPRPAHIAAGIAAGIFNGSRIEPDDPKSKLPALLVKGVFDREWRTVEEKQNKYGETTSVVQVQQPKLVISVLDLRTHLYHTLAQTLERGVSVPTDAAQLGIADLLAHYGQALMQVMERQCRILYDPRRPEDAAIPIVDAARPLFAAQAHAVRACVKLHRTHPEDAPLLLGEIGVGKSVIALTTARSIGARKVLVVCPPHLLDGWTKEIATATPDATVHVLRTISDVDAMRTVRGPAVAILSRETAKLGHAWTSVGITCPRCGAPTPTGVDFAKKRLRCNAQTLKPVDDVARLAQELAWRLRPCQPNNPTVCQAIGVWPEQLARRAEAVGSSAFQGERKAPKYSEPPSDLMTRIFARIVYKLIEGDASLAALLWVHAAAPDTARLARAIPLLFDPEEYDCAAARLAALLPTDVGDALVAAMLEPTDAHRAYRSPKKILQETRERLRSDTGHHFPPHLPVTRVADGALLFDGVRASTLAAADRLLQALVSLGRWSHSATCGEPLFQGVPEPRRFPLARHIARYHRDTFGYVIADEAHEAATEGSAQERAIHRLTQMGVPRLFMTGSFMNGYAESVHTNMWAASRAFRDEFEHGSGRAFSERYGYRKRVLTDKDEDGEIIAFGSQSDRVERSERDAGHAPGILPLFLFRHQLPCAVTVHKSDLRIDIPPHRQHAVTALADGRLKSEYDRLVGALKKQIAADRFEPKVAGKLFGALAELPSFLDRATADVGNGNGEYVIKYPDSLPDELFKGSRKRVIATAQMLPASVVLPKEEAMLDYVKRELAEGRRIMVHGWHLNLLPRLAGLIADAIGEKVPILWADKVPTAKRQAWIDKEIVGKGARVMVTNPVCIQTGLNNLVWFHSIWQHESPACNPIVDRQADGRIDRIGATRETRLFRAYYDGTLQKFVYDLQMAKIAISVATDGLDPESALLASGVAPSDFLTGLSIGKQLWSLMTKDLDDGGDERPALRLIRGGR